MAKPRENDEKDFPGIAPGSNAKLPVSSAPEIQNFAPQIPKEVKPQMRQNKSRVRLRR